MSALQTIPKAAVGGAIKLVRLPADTALRLAPESLTSSAKLAVDSADATVRNVAGTALANPGLREDAQRLREAVDERRRALDLRETAAERTERASERAQRAETEAERKRKQAQADAERKRKE